jgi:hypothetical protein
MNIYQQFHHGFQGEPWHGKSAMAIIDASDPAKVFTHWIPNAHSIAELVIHLTGWTEEALSRLDGKEAGDPRRGDWPPVVQKSAGAWQHIKEEFRNAHRQLMERIANLDEDAWEFKTIDHREGLDEGAADTYAELINGIVQHLAYHSGQISLLQKF